jgi:hypothetical protein
MGFVSVRVSEHGELRGKADVRRVDCLAPPRAMPGNAAPVGRPLPGDDCFKQTLPVAPGTEIVQSSDSAPAPIIVEAISLPSHRPWEEPIVFWHVKVDGLIKHVTDNHAEAMHVASDLSRECGRDVQMWAPPEYTR